MTRAGATLALALAACAGEIDGEADGGGDDGGREIDGGGGDGAAGCVAPIAAPSWLDGYLGGALQALTATPDRATSARRATARAYLQGELAALGLAATLDDYGGGANVVGRLAATTAGGEWIVVGAHYDTVAQTPGADDNATGVAAVLAVARALVAQPCRTRGVMFVLFDQEEVGLIGSTQFAGRQFQLGTAIAAVHTIDQVGWDADGDARFEIEQPTAALWSEYQAGAAAIGVALTRTDSGGTDHEAFRERGFPSAGVTEEFSTGDTTPHYHEPTDTAATIDRAYLARAARLVTYVVARELGAD